VQLHQFALPRGRGSLGLPENTPAMPSIACRFQALIGVRCAPRLFACPATFASPRIASSAVLP